MRRRASLPRRDSCFRSHSFGDTERVMDQAVQHPANCSGFNSECVGMTNLAQDLRFADNHRIEGRSDAEQVPHGLFIDVAIEMRLKESGGQVAGSVEKLRDTPGAKFQFVTGSSAENLHTVTG